MKMKRMFSITVLLFAAALLAFVQPTFAAVNITDLGTLGGQTGQPFDINNAGQVVGWSATTDVNDVQLNHAFLWENGVMTDLGTLGGYSRAQSVNEAGQVVGMSWVTVNGPGHAFLWENGVMTDLGTLGGIWSDARKINNAGQIAGDAMNYSNKWHAFIRDNGVITDLGTIGARDSSRSMDINDSGQVAGFSYTFTSSGYINQRAFIWANGVMTDLGSLGGGISAAIGINEAGQVIGTSTVNPVDDYRIDKHGFIVTPEDTNNDGIPDTWFKDADNDGANDLMTDLGSLTGNSSSPSDINEAGQVVGKSYTFVSTGENSGYYIDQQAFIWENGVMTDLGSLGGTEIEASAINEAGQVVGTSNYHGFLWENGVMTELGSLDGDRSYTYMLNDSGQVSGLNYFYSGNYHPAVWEVVYDPSSQIAELVADVEEINLAAGIENALDSKLDSALQALSDANVHDDVAAINSLNAFINMVEAQRGAKISDTDADYLISSAEAIITLLLNGV